MTAVSPFASTFLFETANVLVLAWALGWLFLKPVRRALAERRADLQARQEEAAAQEAAAGRLLAEAQARQQALQAELDRLRQESRERARQEAAALVAASRAQAEATRATILGEAAHLEAEEEARLAQALALAAGEVVGRLLAEIGGPDLDAALLAAAGRQLAGWAAAAGPVTVEAARPLGEEERTALAQALEPASELRYRVLPELVGGVRIVTPQGQVDATVAGLAAFAGRALTDRLAAAARDGSWS
ncbi:MAG: hypothetical protein AB1634_09680 [Thermodesulfobacteriota bacterium]